MAAALENAPAAAAGFGTRIDRLACLHSDALHVDAMGSAMNRTARLVSIFTHMSSMLLVVLTFSCLQGQPAYADGQALDGKVHGEFAINLASARSPIDTRSISTRDLAPQQTVYTTTIEIDGETWHRVRLGMFATEADAGRALTGLRDEFPRAWITRVSDSERKIFIEVLDEDDFDRTTTPEATAAGVPEESKEHDWQHDSPLDTQPENPTTGTPQSRPFLEKLVRRPDDRRAENPLHASLFGRPLTVGGRYEVSPEHRVNYDLDDTDKRDLTRVYQDARLEVLYEIGESTAAFIETELTYREDRRADGREDSEFDIRRGQSWIYHAFRPETGLAIQIGRQNVYDKRSWWWDADLDAIRLFLDKGTMTAQFGVAKEVFPVSIDDIDDDLPAELDDVTRLFGRWSWKWANRQRLELFWLSERDRSGVVPESTAVLESLADTSDADIDWLGLRARGRWKSKPAGTFFYWADLAGVRGSELLTPFSELDDGLAEAGNSRQVDVRGWAVDAGITLRPRALRDLSFTAGYAVGSGNDEADPSRDQSFRQSGLSTNKVKFRGVVRFRYYGELLRPELSNLRISTLAVGKRFLSASSLELVYHSYRQVNAATNLRSARIDAPLNGENKNIGDAIDLVLGVEEWRHWEMKFIGSMFVAGDAYGTAAGRRAYRADFLVKYTF